MMIPFRFSGTPGQLNQNIAGNTEENTNRPEQP
jgi:hypothetical protein